MCFFFRFWPCVTFYAKPEAGMAPAARQVQPQRRYRYTLWLFNIANWNITTFLDVKSSEINMDHVFLWVIFHGNVTQAKGCFLSSWNIYAYNMRYNDNETIMEP